MAPQALTRMRQIFDRTGQPVVLGELVGETADRCIYMTSSDDQAAIGSRRRVVHLWHVPGKVDQRRLALLLDLRPDAAKLTIAPGIRSLAAVMAWPQDIVLEDHIVAGFIAPWPEIAGFESPEFAVAGAKWRRHLLPLSDWLSALKLAGELAAVAAALRSLRHRCSGFDRLKLCAGAHGELYWLGVDSLDWQSGTLPVASAEAALAEALSRPPLWRLPTSYLADLTPHAPSDPLGRAAGSSDSYSEPSFTALSTGLAVQSTLADDFVVAILLFMLLFMGRHPYAGQNQRKPDWGLLKLMDKAAFPYCEATAHFMSKPRGAAPLAMLGRELVELFEAALGPRQRGHLQPRPSDFMAPLRKLNANVVECHMGHWYPHHNSSCPWCKMERDLDVSMFHVKPLPASSFRIDDYLSYLAAVEIPRHDWPRFDVLEPHPSAGASPPWAFASKGVFGKLLMFVQSSLRRPLRFAGLCGAVAILLAVTFYFGVSIGLMLGVLVLFLMTLTLPDDAVRQEPDRLALRQAQMGWSEAERVWHDKAGDSAFEAKLMSIQRLRREYSDHVQNCEIEKLALQQNKREVQLALYLDQQFLHLARLPGFTREHILMLQAYGIETAADLGARRLQGIPGLTHPLLAGLAAWRQACEEAFLYDPKEPLPNVLFDRIDRQNWLDRRRFEQRLKAALADLMTIRDRIVAVRASLQPGLDRAWRIYAAARRKVQY